MSQKTKDYILNLDIQKDARVLREHLNVSSDALDFLYASSSILKAGVVAGLSLYEIAIMCCRNDNLGETPSKLEVLFEMAREIAYNSVKNGRWHHAAASRALAEQLSPQGASLLNPNLKMGLRFGEKAQSAFDLNQLAHDLEHINENTKAEGTMPGMIHSAGSDSSSDTGDVDGECDGEAENCDEWAANLIADVSMTTSSRFLNNTKSRSASIESDGSSESIGGGFWQKSPGSLEDSSLDGTIDEESISWSNSPDRDVLEGSFLHDSRMSYNPFDAARRSSFVFDNESRVGLGLDEPTSLRAVRPLSRPASKVSFLDSTIKASEDDVKFKHSNSDVGEKPEVLNVSIKPRNLKRSQSYSAMPTTHAEMVKAKEETKTNRFSLTEGQEVQYQDYFLQFVDLVIARETTSVATSKGEALKAI